MLRILCAELIFSGKEDFSEIPLKRVVQNFYWVLTTVLAEEGVSQENLSLTL